MAVAVYCTQTITIVYIDKCKIFFSTTLSLVLVDFDCSYCPIKERDDLIHDVKGSSNGSLLQ